MRAGHPLATHQSCECAWQRRGEQMRDQAQRTRIYCIPRWSSCSEFVISPSRAASSESLREQRGIKLASAGNLRLDCVGSFRSNRVRQPANSPETPLEERGAPEMRSARLSSPSRVHGIDHGSCGHCRCAPCRMASMWRIYLRDVQVFSSADTHEPSRTACDCRGNPLEPRSGQGQEFRMLSAVLAQSGRVNRS